MKEENMVWGREKQNKKQNKKNRKTKNKRKRKKKEEFSGSYFSIRLVFGMEWWKFSGFLDFWKSVRPKKINWNETESDSDSEGKKLVVT